MIFTIPDILNPDELAHLQTSLEMATFVDGKLTAGWHAKLVKHNQQVRADDQKDLRDTIKAALHRNELFQLATRPRSVHSILFSRYDVGMSYGRHVDNALMAGSALLRSDLSFTIFLNSPSDYEGGELVIEAADCDRTVKLAAGSMIVYPSTTLHQVEPITRGVRLVAVGWVQSLIRDESQRDLLFDLDTVRRSLFAQSGKSVEFDLLSKSVANLLRMWAE